ncbi:Acyl-CoA dehydrogenase/oxidase C-terminal [Syntrophomonas zehnderi OL-4]|uniref:Acyl-CoA dehydrogenase/oxidase C-terminal n=1 Tax=Syntrophomonas zehnderi OL-4 TaxID=690567 RepID=A0A0E3W3G7_9FIRM|nr:acyl-CoA dehydrogenase [Syntrophomonas zehnderi]CFX81459.1 Acyl-CoA dehydrogenase/oxidase C-terminal [Syntrophomonas zehnderi OL-4]
MNFELNDEQIMFRKMVRDFAENEVAPSAATRDEEERFDMEIFYQMGELGICGIPWDEEYGGAGADYIFYAIAVEELSRVCASTGVTLSAHTSLCSWPIYRFGTHEQKMKYLKPLAEGIQLGAFGITEPSAGSDAGGTKCTAKKDGNSYILNGTKIFITNAFYADTYIVIARTGPKELGSKGISAFIVEKDTPGFSFGKKEKKMGIKSSATYELVFEDCRIPAENLLGKEGEGFKIGMMILDGGRTGIAAQALGIAQGAYEYALDYARQRVQFGKPISELQSVRFKLADMATQIEAARLLVYQAAYMESNDIPYGKASAMAKVFAGDTAMAVTTEAVQILGGYGYTREYPVERMMRDAKITQIYEGTNEIQRVVIANSILR